MNVTREQAKMALSTLKDYFKNPNSGDDLHMYIKQLLILQNSDDYIKLFVNMSCGTESPLAYHRMEDFNDIFRNIPPFDIALGIVHGKFNPVDDYFYLTDDNEFISVSAYYLLPVAYEHFNEVLEYVIDTNRVSELIKNLEKCDKKG